MAAGFTLRELANLPLSSWSALYGAVKARELEQAAMNVSVVHSSSPNKMRKHLLDSAKRMEAGFKKMNVVGDPARLRRMVQSIPGVKVDKA